MTEEITIDRGTRKTLAGKVVSDKGDKTIVVEVERLTKQFVCVKSTTFMTKATLPVWVMWSKSWALVLSVRKSAGA
jgi:hypothetical protein